MLFLALVSSANQHCRTASAHGKFHLFGFRLEGINHLSFRIFICLTGGLGGRWQQARLSRCGPHWEVKEGGVRCGHWCGCSQVLSCAGHML